MIDVVSGIVGDLALTPGAAAVAVGQDEDKGGGFPWLIAGVGGAAVIIAVAALAGGGGGGGDEGPSTGGVTVTFPN